MRSQTRDAIGAPELRTYLDTLSDFAFELRVLSLLRRNGWRCEHGGSYEDNVTRKSRQFDIRAEWSTGITSLHLAVECKNIRPDHPLLVLRVPREDFEAHNDITIRFPPDETPPGATPERHRSRRLRLDRWNSIYDVGAPVGKSCAQVSSQGGKLFGTDADVYEKWAQALQSARDLIDYAASVPSASSGVCSCSAVFPYVVIPDGSLWVADYDSEGNITGDPHPEDDTSYFVERSYVATSEESQSEYLISHLEFLTVRGLQSRLQDVTTDQYLSRLFPMRAIKGILQTW